jgi:hypothetical protein
MSLTAASAMLEPEKRTLLLKGKNYTPWTLWMRGRLLKKGLGLICSEDEKDFRLTPEKEAHEFHLLLSSMSESTFSRVLTFGSYSANFTRVNMQRTPPKLLLLDLLLHRPSCSNGKPTVRAKGLVEGLPKLDHSLKFIAPLCTGCLLGKFARRPLRPTAKKARSVCEKFTWISKVRWIWWPSENIFTFWN